MSLERSPDSGGAGGPEGGPKILVVDDSAVVRQALTQILRGAGMQVDTAVDPVIAIPKIKRARPDLVILDIEMPRMDGLTFLRWLMTQEDPVPTLICSGKAGPGSEVAVEALERGAVGIVLKPALDVKNFLYHAADQLVEAVKGALQARVRRRTGAAAPRRLDAGAVLPARPPPATGGTAAGSRLVAVGASTGGTEAIRLLLEHMPADGPGLVIVQHMPEGFTGAFARRLADSCRIEVSEAVHGERVRPGRALIAPGNHHLVVRRGTDGYFVEILDGPPVSRHRPSVDVLFRSVAQAAGCDAVGVILTGMGNDGVQGMLEMKQAGAHCIAQDEATCVVFGMPKEAIAAGAVHETLPLDRIPAAVLRVARAALAP